MSDNSNTETVSVEMVDVSGKQNVKTEPAQTKKEDDMYGF